MSIISKLQHQLSDDKMFIQTKRKSVIKSKSGPDDKTYLSRPSPPTRNLFFRRNDAGYTVQWVKNSG